MHAVRQCPLGPGLELGLSELMIAPADRRKSPLSNLPQISSRVQAMRAVLGRVKGDCDGVIVGLAAEAERVLLRREAVMLSSLPFNFL